MEVEIKGTDINYIFQKCQPWPPFIAWKVYEIEDLFRDFHLYKEVNRQKNNDDDWLQKWLASVSSNAKAFGGMREA